MPSLITFKQVVESLELGVLLLDQDLTLLYLNDWLFHRCDISPETALRRPLVEVFPELANSRLLECCVDALRENLPSRLSNSFNPSPLPIYDPKHMGNDLYRLQQAISVRPVALEDRMVCELVIYDVTTNVIKENWLKRVATNFRLQAQQKDTSLEQLSRIIENTGDAILVFSKRGVIELANAAAKQLLGLQEQTLNQATLRDLLPVDRDEHHATLYDRLMLTLDRIGDRPSQIQIPSVTTQLRNGQGELAPVELRFSISHDQGDTKLITIIRDCSDQVETERNFRESENRFQTLAKIAPVGIFRTCDQGIVRYANENWLSLTGCHLSDLHHVSWLDFIDDKFRDKITPKWNSVRSTRIGLREEFRLKPMGVEIEPTWVLCNLMAEFDAQDNINGFVGVLTDITQQRANQEEIERLAYHDMLTGLPNRRHFRNTLERQIRLNRREQRSFALFALDLNGFKAINDSLGHDAGDLVLKATGERLQAILRESAFISRIGGDEFCVLIPGFDDIKSLETIAQRIINIAKEPIQLESREVNISTSIGIAMFPTDAENAGDLLKNADLALYAAKGNKQDPFVFFNQRMNQKAETNRALVTDLETAITEEQFELYLQPVINGVHSGRVIARAMMLWQHASWGEILQPDFINVLERSRLARPFTLIFLEQMCHCFGEIREQLPNIDQVTMVATLTSFQLMHTSFCDDIQTMLKRYQVPAQLLEIEFSEKNTNDYFGSLLPVLLRLQRLGCQLTLTDFDGSELAISRISKLPISGIKLDSKLLQNARHHRESQFQLGAVIDLARRLGVSLECDIELDAEISELLSAVGANQLQLTQTLAPKTRVDYLRFLTDDSAAQSQTG